MGFWQITVIKNLQRLCQIVTEVCNRLIRVCNVLDPWDRLGYRCEFRVFGYIIGFGDLNLVGASMVLM